MTDPEPLPGLDEYAIAAEFPALIICTEGDCGGHTVATDTDAGAAFLTGHARRHHDGRFIRFRLQSQKPTDLAALIQPSDVAPAAWDRWEDGPYNPERNDDA